MPMQPRPMAETFGPVLPSFRLSMVLFLRRVADDPAPPVSADMAPLHCDDKIDNSE
jgi:hypothetical protein